VLFGCGKMGIQHLRALAAVPSVRVVGIADPVPPSDEVRSLVPVDAMVTDDPSHLLATVSPDVVHIVTPPSTHGPLATMALEAGCHVFVEKPFTLRMEEASAVLALAERRGRLVCAGHQYLFEAPAIGVMEHLAEIGRMVHVESRMAFRTVRRTITSAEQCKDILPHAVYPLIQQLRAGSTDPSSQIQIVGVDARASGDVCALLRLGECSAVLTVTLSGRPVEQYQDVLGTNGSLRADYIAGSAIRLPGPGSGIGALFVPYRRSLQTIVGATRTVVRRLTGSAGSYPGLSRLTEEFYSAITVGGPSPISPSSILDTVDVCARLGAALDEAVTTAETLAAARLAAAEREMPAPWATSVVLVTGGTGFLGRPVAMELRSAGFRTRVLARRIPPPSQRIPGVEYVACDLAERLSDEALSGVDTIVHCAAETAGGRGEQERNSIVASRSVVEGARRSGIRRIVHISSIAVLKPSREVGGVIAENSPVDSGNEERGPYVWGKAESEIEMQRLAGAADLDLRIIRPGPLVDYRDFAPPGRLGREVGPWFIAIGSRRAELHVCDVWTAARVVRSYVQDFGAAPPLLNLLEHPAPTRHQLAQHYSARRPDLRFRWIPSFVIAMLNVPAKLAQRLLLGTKQPVDLRSAFSSEPYSTDLASQVISRAGPSSIASDDLDQGRC